MADAHDPRPEEGWKPRGRATVRMWRIYIWFLETFGRLPIYGSLFVTTTIYALNSSDGRRGLETYLDRTFPDDGRLVRLWRVMRVFYNYALCITDRFIALSKGRAAFKWIREDHEELLAMLEGDTGFVVLTTHCGNPEMLGTAVHGLSTVQKRVHVVRYQAEGDPYAELLASSKSEFAPEIIALNAGNDMASMKVVRALRSGAVAAFLADRPVDERVVRVPFLGGEIDLPLGPWLVASLARVPVVLLSCFKEGPFTYRLLCTPPVDVTVKDRRQREAILTEHAHRFAGQLETWVRRYPYQFYNFHDLWDPEAAKLRG